MNRHLVLVGLMGCGKSTVARILRKRFDCALYEIDYLIENRAGKPIPQIFQEQGEDKFRQWEEEIVLGLGQNAPGIISTGGGTFAQETNRQCLLEIGWVFYLHGTPEHLAGRIQSPESRPLLHGRDKVEVLRELYTKRDAAYRQAHVTIATDHCTSQQVAEEVARSYEAKQTLALETEQ